jgi:hypothetical protein
VILGPRVVDANPHGDVPGGGTGCLWHIVREEDVNVDLGNQFTPQIPPPPCTGDMHVIDQSTLTPRSVFFTGDQATSPSQPLCDKRLIEPARLRHRSGSRRSVRVAGLPGTPRTSVIIPPGPGAPLFDSG